MTTPAWRSIMPGPTSRAHSSGPRTFTSIFRHHSLGSRCHTGPKVAPTPALLTRMSIGPSVATTSEITAAIAAASVTSARQPRAWPPASMIADAVSSSWSFVRAVTATEAPAEASAVAKVRPSPRPPPVTSAAFPSRTSVVIEAHLADLPMPRLLDLRAVRTERPQHGGHGDQRVEALVGGGANPMRDPSGRDNDVARRELDRLVADDDRPRPGKDVDHLIVIVPVGR